MKYFTLLLVLIFLNTSLYPQWQIQNSGTTENLNDVAVLDQITAIVVGENGTILKTTNNGLNWIARNCGTLNNLNAVSFLDEQYGIVVGNEALCRTTDGGESWTDTTLTDNFVSVSYREPYFSGGNIIIGSEYGAIFYSCDDGNMWEDTILIPFESIVTVGFNYYSPSLTLPIVYAATTHYTAASLFPTNNWISFENPVNPANDIITGGEFYDWNQYLVGWSSNPGPIPLLLKRIDSDTTWEIVYSFVPQPYAPEDICAGTTSLNEILYVCGSNGKIYKSTDRGDSWSEQYTNITENLNAIDFVNDTIGYCVGENGTILFTSNGGISSVEEAQSPTGYYLYQNYPNPFNPTTTIRFKIAERCSVSLIVFDILGREVSRLVEEEKPAGEYSVEFNVEDSHQIPITSGVYFYQLNAGNYTTTRKMILAK
jgi:hypothetical protein